MTRFDDGCRQQRNPLCIFVIDHPLLSVFVAAVFGIVVGNIARIFFL